ncbi:hypothetical protein QBC47DRAFT_20714 [Echria macrotheca]|uniref:Uncharacterized protein n=1 Tax=Echria macrotheca TaxID=438768 RepID=A0AAJ0BMT1_9PEZI|nr:hypothetical protein QBC47DRAFT_20714 [Echria macrotheca]
MICPPHRNGLALDRDGNRQRSGRSHGTEILMNEIYTLPISDASSPNSTLSSFSLDSLPPALQTGERVRPISIPARHGRNGRLGAHRWIEGKKPRTHRSGDSQVRGCSPHPNGQRHDDAAVGGGRRSHGFAAGFSPSMPSFGLPRSHRVLKVPVHRAAPTCAVTMASIKDCLRGRRAVFAIDNSEACGSDELSREESPIFFSLFASRLHQAAEPELWWPAWRRPRCRPPRFDELKGGTWGRYLLGIIMLVGSGPPSPLLGRMPLWTRNKSRLFY